MNVQKIKNTIKDITDATLPELLGILPTLFPSGITLALSGLGTIALNFSQIKDDNQIKESLANLEKKITNLSLEENEIVLKKIKKVCESEVNHFNCDASKEIYTIDFFEIVLRGNRTLIDEYGSQDGYASDSQIVLECLEEHLEKGEISGVDYVYSNSDKTIMVNLLSYLTKNEVQEIIEEIDELIIEDCKPSFGKSFIKEIYYF